MEDGGSGARMTLHNGPPLPPESSAGVNGGSPPIQRLGLHSAEAPSSDSVALSVLIPTLPRELSVRRTIAALEGADVAGPVEVILVDNGSTPTLALSREPRPGICAIRVLHEPRSGKTAAVNRALVRETRGELVAILDDDMEPAPGWCASVIRAAARRPAFDIFTGRSHVVWPAGVEQPSWAQHPFAVGCAFSAVDLGAQEDREMGVNAPAFPSGNHFWFRRRVLESVREFPDSGLLTDAEFVLRARRAGHRGVFVPEVSCGHRIQPHLVDPRVFASRAFDLGRGLSRIYADDPSRRSAARPRMLAVAIREFAFATLWALRGATTWVHAEAKRVPAHAWARYRQGRCGAHARIAMREFLCGRSRRDVPVS